MMSLSFSIMAVYFNHASRKGISMIERERIKKRLKDIKREIISDSLNYDIPATAVKRSVKVFKIGKVENGVVQILMPYKYAKNLGWERIRQFYPLFETAISNKMGKDYSIEIRIFHDSIWSFCSREAHYSE